MSAVSLLGLVGFLLNLYQMEFKYINYISYVFYNKFDLKYNIRKLLTTAPKKPTRFRYPSMDSIQKYLWPRLCKLPQETL